ncbi:hypothetical protein [Nitrospirillum iridis]|uniref:General secretion pathway protein K n=1 Tax=Nitrospirillum iridis TaxID=765888 RepID=A0A7X0B2B0_9PROT|nr:hypothetical protein [Nitrospirillum iridis]MBB6253390.1 hypothetical protein [Nitrospirillum iridis]
MRPNPDGAPAQNRADHRRGQGGYALLLTLFLLAVGTAVGYLVVGNGLSARKLTRAASQAAGASQRAALATWQVLDGTAASGKAPVAKSGQLTVDGQTVSLIAMSETGRIDLNGLSRRALAEAIQSLGFPERRAAQAADQIAQWRGMDPPGADGTNLAMNGRTALWSLEDLDAIAGLEPEVRACLFLWGTVHARGPFGGKEALTRQDFATTGFGSNGGLIVGTMVRVVATDVLTGKRFRTIALFRGVSRRLPGENGRPVPPPWMILEWLKPAPTGGVNCP